MLETIQIITILQGLFLIIVLFIRRKDYKPVNFRLLIGSVLAVALYALGDDDFNLFVDDANWYFFHDILFISFFYLFVKYYHSSSITFIKKDYICFIPYVLYVLVQLSEEILGEEKQFILKLAVIGLAIVMLVYLGTAIFTIIKNGKAKWMLFFIIPYTLLYFSDRAADAIFRGYDTIPFFESYGVIGLSAFLFYFLVFKLIITPKTVLPKAEELKYRKSSLSEQNIDKYKKEIEKLLTEDKIFKNNGLSVQDMADKLGIPRQYLTEILNAHMKIGFQELLSQYRVEEFIKYLNDKDYRNYTLMAIANEVGFSSKTTFNTAFKKITGMTPSEYKKRITTTD
jgi:AraC-like DNA-binding protein